MNSKRIIYWSAQIIGWTFYAGLLVFASYANKSEQITFEFLLKVFGLEFFAILSTHLMRNVFIKLGWMDLKPAPLLPRLLLASLLASLLFSMFYEGFSYLVEVHNNSYKLLTMAQFFIQIFSVMVLMLFWNALYFTYHYFVKSKDQEVKNALLESSKNEIELKNLRSQLNPHFLFNSLNSIRALIDIEPKEAKRAVTSLSNLMRNSLQLGKMDLISLEEEIEMVKSYLDLEKIRFEERLDVSWYLNANHLDDLIPPFSIQTLVENAIKHGISKQIHGGTIEVRIEKSDKQLKICVCNPGELNSTTDLGIGVDNINRRLALQFGTKAKFNLKQQGDRVLSEIVFDLV